MKRRRILPLLLYTALLTSALVILSQGDDSKVMRAMKRQARQVKGALVRSHKAARSEMRLIEAEYLGAQAPEIPKDI